MQISRNSQLGLRLGHDLFAQDKLLHILKNAVSNTIALLKEAEDRGADENGVIRITMPEPTEQNVICGSKEQHFVAIEVGDKIESPSHGACESKHFFICNSVYEASRLIKIAENFTSRTLKDIKLGTYTYLMGKHTMVRFTVGIGAIRGFYFDDKKDITFDWGCLTETGKYYAPHKYEKEFSSLMQILTFVELGDIEIKILEGGKSNGARKKEEKIVNSTNKTVYVVDSTWNQILIRTEGFAVRGHFKLQPCGPGNRDRKLIWINAFEKHGYKRRPKGEIIR